MNSKLGTKVNIYLCETQKYENKYIPNSSSLTSEPKLSMSILSPPDARGNVKGRKPEWKQAAALTDHSHNIWIFQFLQKRDHVNTLTEPLPGP